MHASMPGVCGAGDGAQGLVHVKQELYSLSDITSLFLFFHFILPISVETNAS